MRLVHALAQKRSNLPLASGFGSNANAGTSIFGSNNNTTGSSMFGSNANAGTGSPFGGGGGGT